MDCDLVVIGAGIQGAGVAQAASAAGYNVIVLEQYDKPALGTSSRSSKLIHGGLRYLETGQFSLVKECLVERTRLLRNAPHLVKLVPFYIPVYKNSHYSSLKIAAGLSFYSLISLKPFRQISKKNWASLDGLQQKNLTAVYQYYDAQTDDTKLTEAVLASAESMGAQTFFNSTFVTADIADKSCTVHYQHNGEDKRIDCYAIVNAAGPWVKHIVRKIKHPDSLYKQAQPDIELVQGTHIELPVTPPQGIYYLEAPQDNRAVFVMPWQDHLLIGTTETPYTGNPADVKPLTSEITYLLNIYNHYFAHGYKQQLRNNDIINAFAGLRVLPQGTGKSFTRPRDTLIVGNAQHSSRFLTLYGGKLTAYRSTSESVLKKLAVVLPATTSSVDTRTLSL